MKRTLKPREEDVVGCYEYYVCPSERLQHGQTVTVCVCVVMVTCRAAVKLYANSKMPHVHKFVSFIKKNSDVPFFVNPTVAERVIKGRVLEAVLMSSLLYGCESWLSADLKPILIFIIDV